MAFAHAKILLLGEHAVVHGEPALAAGLDVGVEARIEPGPAGISCPAWQLEARVGDGSKVAAALVALSEALGLPAARLVLDAGVPAGAGLGSSAAMAVACARALAEHAGVALSDDALSDAAFASERVFHGNPSGLDHTVAIKGGLLRYVRGTPPRVERVRAAGPLRLVIAQVQPGADTGRMVAGVAAQRDRLGDVAARLHATIGALVVEAERAIVEGDQPRLGELMNIDHHLLGAIGVSNASLDAACHAAREAGALGAKLTGAGGGGCIIALVDQGCEDAVRDALDPGSIGVYAASVG